MREIDKGKTVEKIAQRNQIRSVNFYQIRNVERKEYDKSNR